MLFGGGRSGKTFLIVRAIVLRALKAPGSRHLITRSRFNHLKASVMLDTFPKVMRVCFSQLVKGKDWDINMSDGYATLPGGSQIWFLGLDDKDRMEKVLGLEFATIYVNEASQVTWAGVQLLLTRLAQRVMQLLPGRDPAPLKLRYLFDCNPPSKAHWAFKVFKQKLDPETKEPLTRPDNYASFQMNPVDNASNLSPEYLETLRGLSGRMKRRFVDGEFAEATPNALFDEGVIDAWRVDQGDPLPDFVRVVVSVDPSGASDDEANADNDEVGIAVDALGTDGRAYLLEDLSVKGGPSTWGRVAVQAYQRHKADIVVGESNFGGGMVKSTVQVAAAALGMRVPVKLVTASRGKVQRAEPFSAMYEDGKVRHVGIFAKLEDELCAFSTGGYTGPRSPNRADAHIWALAELFPAMTKPAAHPPVEPLPMVNHFRRTR
ncbi:MAG: phage terminase large subunit [Betaproteobacteria bacterium]|nr:phage terminase large subunit [Betaproteobacteria bacterium]